jgi:hypothetical protein
MWPEEITIPRIPAREQGARELSRRGDKAGHEARPPLPHAADYLGQRTKGGGGGQTIVTLTIDTLERMPAPGLESS